jgi:hypothetical protein
MLKRPRSGVFVGILIVVISFLLLFFSFMGGGGSKIDSAPYENENPNNSRMAIMSNGDELFDVLGNATSYDYVSSDLFLFAKTAYLKYSDEKQSLGFMVSSVSQKNGVIYVSGRFGATNNEIKIVIEKLKKNRIKLQITDEKTKLNIDNLLDSNSSKNQFIGSLPLDESGFTITYLDDKDTFLVNVFNSSENYEKAVSLIRTTLGEDVFSQQKIAKYGAGDKTFDNGF